jgi:hypothetical protein
MHLYAKPALATQLASASAAAFTPWCGGPRGYGGGQGPHSPALWGELGHAGRVVGVLLPAGADLLDPDAVQAWGLGLTVWG